MDDVASHPSFPYGHAPTHVHSEETPVAPEISPSLPEEPSTPLAVIDTFRHSGWKNHRTLIFDALQAAQAPWARLERFAQCGTSAWILRSDSDPESFRVVPDHCHDRLCVPCGGSRQSVIRRNLDSLLKDRPHRFLTLTIRHHDESLRTLLDRLYRAFRLLRNRRLWKDRVRGGVAFLELTYNSEHKSWHPHLHCMLDGLYIHRPDLSELWLACTGDSCNLNLKLIRSKAAVVLYVSKYITMPLPPSIVTNSECLIEAIETLKGRRMVLTFGTWKNWKLLHDLRDDGWTLYKHLNDLTYHADRGDVLCEHVLAMLPTADPKTGVFIVHVEVPEPDD